MVVDVKPDILIIDKFENLCNSFCYETMPLKEIKYISKRLKKLANYFNVPIIVFSSSKKNDIIKFNYDDALAIINFDLKNSNYIFEILKGTNIFHN